MSEREYIEHLLGRATAYIEAIREGVSHQSEVVQEWEGCKGALSAHTLRDLCWMWIAHDNLKSPEST